MSITQGIRAAEEAGMLDNAREFREDGGEICLSENVKT
jgi:hypothetical protein